MNGTFMTSGITLALLFPAPHRDSAEAGPARLPSLLELADEEIRAPLVQPLSSWFSAAFTYDTVDFLCQACAEK